jgi:hypothetical protein
MPTSARAVVDGGRPNGVSLPSDTVTNTYQSHLRTVLSLAGR